MIADPPPQRVFDLHASPGQHPPPPDPNWIGHTPPTSLRRVGICCCDGASLFRRGDWLLSDVPSGQRGESDPRASDSEVLDAHEHCNRNRDEVCRSGVCGCFYCCNTFAPEEISTWIGPPPDATALLAELAHTALCPRCGVDSVLGDSSGYPITSEFLARMRAYWFAPNT